MVQDDVEPDEDAGAAMSPSGPEASNGSVHQSSDFLLVFFHIAWAVVMCRNHRTGWCRTMWNLMRMLVQP